jgi:hypothetical protein
MRIELNIQDQNLTPEARQILIGLLHRLEKEPEKFTMENSLVAPSPEPEVDSDEPTLTAAEAIRLGREERKPLKPITPQEFFSKIMETKGFESKEAAHKHVQELRAEWD